MCWCPNCSTFICQCDTEQKDHQGDAKSMKRCDACGGTPGDMSAYYRLNAIEQNLAGSRYGKERIGRWCDTCGAFIPCQPQEMPIHPLAASQDLRG